jgi:hypothetical protein
VFDDPDEEAQMQAAIIAVDRVHPSHARMRIRYLFMRIPYLQVINADRQDNQVLESALAVEVCEFVAAALDQIRNKDLDPLVAAIGLLDAIKQVSLLPRTLEHQCIYDST